MEDFITLKSKADLPGFISTDHTGSRGLQGYDDDTFDSINRKAFEALKNSKIIDFYNETEADQIEEALGQTLRGAEGDLTLQDALKGNARNFFTTLDLENPNVMRAIGQYGFAQAISAGGLVKPLKALLFTEKDGNKRVLTGDAKNWKTRQMLEGLKDAQNTYYRDAAERMLNAEYYSDMKGLIGDKIELTNNEHSFFLRKTLPNSKIISMASSNEFTSLIQTGYFWDSFLISSLVFSSLLPMIKSGLSISMISKFIVFVPPILCLLAYQISGRTQNFVIPTTSSSRFK